MPKRVWYRKSQRGRIRGRATRGNTVEFGEFGLQALDPAWLDNHQIEAARIAISHTLSREGRLFVRVFPHKSVTAKPLESRMGKGKGEPDRWVVVVRPGMVIFEVSGVDEDLAREALRRAAQKVPFRSRMIRRRTAL